MKEFKYKEYITPLPNNKIQIVPRPNAEVTIHNGSIVRVFDMLIDSGADISLIPKSIGEELGLEIEHDEKIRSVTGFAGSAPAVERKLIFEIDGYKIPCPVGWVLVDGFPLILGREGVFDHFHIEFLQDIETVRFNRVK